MIDPKTINISPSGYTTDEILAASVGDTTLVFIRNIFKYMIYKMGSIRPGTRAPKNKSAIVILSGLKIPIFNCACWYDDDKTSARRINTKDGGIIWPSVPAAHIVPVATLVEYPFLTNTG